MSSYYNYRFRTHSLMSTHKKLYGYNVSAKEVWNSILENHDDTTDSMEIVCMAEECVALAETPNFLFINNVKLAQAIQRSSFQAESLVLEEGIKFLSFPKGFQIDGRAAQGVMFAAGDCKERELWLHTMQFNAGSQITGYNMQEGIDGYVSFTYNSPDEASVVCRLQIPTEKLPQFIAAETIEEMRAIFGHQHIGLPMDDVGHTYQLRICHMTLKALVYVQALPDKLFPGCPDKRAGANKFKPNGYVIKAPDGLRNVSNPNMVGYVFRNLQHEKYYKGEHKNKKLGSRWVFVEPYTRGMKAKTIKE